MRPGVIHCIIALICMTSLSGCGTQVDLTSEVDQTNQAEGTQENSELPDSDSSTEAVSLDSIAGTSGVFIENGGTCIELSGLPPHGDFIVRDLYPHDDEYYREVSVLPLDSPKHSVSGGAFTAFSPNEGDQIITTIGDRAAYYPVQEVGYFGGASNIEIKDDSEINGVKVVRENDILQIDKAFSSAGLNVVWVGELPENDYGIKEMVYSKEPCSYTCGSYMGTNWIEESVAIDNPCYLISFQDKTDLPVTKTKEGYFIIDTSQLVSGKYVISSGNCMFLIDLV